MSRLITLDEILDLISDVREIDTIVFSPPHSGLVSLELLCESESHSELMLTEEDFEKLTPILANTILLRPL